MAEEKGRDKLVLPVLLLALALLSFGWTAFADHTFEMFTFCLFGSVEASLGFFLLFGKARASGLLARLGLERQPEPELNSNGRITFRQRSARRLAGILTFSAIWHFLLGWTLCSAILKGTLGAVFGLWLFGMIPFILAPYCRRQKAWALWSTLVLYGPIFFLESVALCGLFSRFSPRELGSGADVFFCIGA
jgi:hypothetical protein